VNSNNGRITAIQIPNGLGAGNIGDELMARAFWKLAGDRFDLQVPLMDAAPRQRQPYPTQFRYLNVNWQPIEEPSPNTQLGLLVGDTPVTEREGLDWPLRFLQPRLLWFHHRNVPVHAIAVGVDLLDSSEALAIFRSSFLPIRSWTVRSRSCGYALTRMGIPPDRIMVTADLAWLYRSSGERSMWARQVLSEQGLRFDRPIVMVNALNLVWRSDKAFKLELAHALSKLVRFPGFVRRNDDWHCGAVIIHRYIPTNSRQCSFFSTLH
jgi:hypothetical protein